MVVALLAGITAGFTTGAVGVAPKVAAEPSPDAAPLSPDDFLAVFDEAILPGLAPIGLPPSIFGDPVLDARIRSIGESRGYRRRAEPSRDLVAIDGVYLQPEAAAAWSALKTGAAAAGHTLIVTSGYRSAATQTVIFKRRLAGTSDDAINTRLRSVAVPGYSKHHTAYAIDIRSSNSTKFTFSNTTAYQWLAADNFANAKAYGWVPSYPNDSSPAGPLPEPWELVWVGATNLGCADFVATASRPFCDTEMSTFAANISWLHQQEITTGCRPGRFCTTAAIQRGEAATMIWR
ncbi:MAG: M15 family metallopeptidase, partial [bacterium]|nr:M15 family metallopeptidase [bacterium]